jgi:hypothetical protein
MARRNFEVSAQALQSVSTHVTVLYTLIKSARQARLNRRSRSESAFPDNSAIASFCRFKLGLSEILDDL